MFQLHICSLGLLIFYCVLVPSEPIHIPKLLTLLPLSQLSSDWPGFGQQVGEARLLRSQDADIKDASLELLRYMDYFSIQ